MSLATLKAKYSQKQNISKDQTFSLTGGNRNKSYIGKNSLRHPTCTYTTNDSSIIKKTTSNNHSLISTINKEEQVAKQVTGSVCGIGAGALPASNYINEQRASRVECISVGDQKSSEHTEELKLRIIRNTFCPE